jgi:hypothetical protein
MRTWKNKPLGDLGLNLHRQGARSRGNEINSTVGDEHFVHGMMSRRLHFNHGGGRRLRLIRRAFAAHEQAATE